MMSTSKFLFLGLMMLTTLYGVKAQTIERKDMCSGLQFAIKELLAGREQTTIKGAVNKDDATYHDCRFIFNDWQGVGTSEPDNVFTITFYTQASEKVVKDLFVKNKKEILGCALTDAPLVLTTDTPDRIEFNISNIYVLMLIMPGQSRNELPNLVMVITKKV